MFMMVKLRFRFIGLLAMSTGTSPLGSVTLAETSPIQAGNPFRQPRRTHVPGFTEDITLHLNVLPRSGP